MKKLYLISNDKIWCTKNFYTSNNDLNNIISCLNSDYKIHLICRESSNKFDYRISEKCKFTSIKDMNEGSINILMIFTLIRLIFLGKKIKGFVYLRSDGFLEYKIKYSLFGYYIYLFMLNITKRYL